MQIEKIKISDLKPNPKNPRKSTPEQEENLRKSLEKFGVVEPIIFNKRTGQIVGGHFRVRELQKLGAKEVEAVIVDLSEQDEAELNIRLNANTGEWDWGIIESEWDRDELEEWGIEIAYKNDEIDYKPELNPLSQIDDVTEDEINKQAKKLAEQMVKEHKVINVICPECGHEFKVS